MLNCFDHPYFSRRGLWLNLRFTALIGAGLLGALAATAQPDYGPAHWVPTSGCTKWYTSGNGHNFCVIHDMEGYYWTSISYLNRCDTNSAGNYNVSASVYYLVNGLQNGSDTLNHRENNPTDPVAGDITQSVREQNYAWHATCWNRYMFGTEHEGFVTTPVWYSEAMYQASADLHRHLCDTYGIPKDRNHIIGHDEKKNAGWVGWMQTNWPAIDPSCNTHTDPGQYWDWTHYLALINAAPTITAQPQSQTVNQGTNVTFTVTASGATPLAYQWRFNAANIAGATATNYTRSNVQLADLGSYSVVVTNQLGSVTSADAVLALASAPLIASQPLDQVVVVGQGAALSVVAFGISPLAYQWEHNGASIPGATNASLLFAPAQYTHAGAYSVLITNTLGWAQSSNAWLTVIGLDTFGDNSWGQTNLSSAMTNVIAVAAGAWHNLALRANGTVLAWGSSYSGQCEVPATLTDALAIAAGGYHSLAIRANGAVLAWGNNDYGQTNVPADLKQAIGLAAGTWHSLALQPDGTVLAWGDDSFGQCSVPAGLNNVVALAAGGNHSLALRADGTVVGWGENTDGEGFYAGQSSPPLGLTNVVALAAGEYHSLAVLKTGALMAWGDDAQGQCDIPLGLTNVVAAAGGGAHSLALRADGSVVAWGADWNGQCSQPAALNDVVGLGAGEDHSVALVAGTLPEAKLLNAGWQEGEFRSLVQTLNRRSYAVDYKNSLAAPTWIANWTNSGNGALRPFSDPNASGPQRFYRVRQW